MSNPKKREPKTLEAPPRLIDTIDLSPDELRELKAKYRGDKRLKLAYDPDDVEMEFP